MMGIQIDQDRVPPESIDVFLTNGELTEFRESGSFTDTVTTDTSDCETTVEYGESQYSAVVVGETPESGTLPERILVSLGPDEMAALDATGICDFVHEVWGEYQTRVSVLTEDHPDFDAEVFER